MVFEVEDGKLTGVRGNPDHPMTNGGLCVKLKDYEKRHYHPDRLLYPMRRTGPKGSKTFERITWDEALDEITNKWKAIIDEHGSQAILPCSYLGHQGLVHGLNGGDAFFARMGATVMERTFCGEGSCTAWLMTVGPTAGVAAGAERSGNAIGNAHRAARWRQRLPARGDPFVERGLSALEHDRRRLSSRRPGQEGHRPIHGGADTRMPGAE